ncbi:MAG TPA: hypothetical protein VLA56_21050, partial [Pseudomonadales bacterium]|nr:hypothetical protein [Pseudomonadales bacterium]
MDAIAASARIMTLLTLALLVSRVAVAADIDQVQSRFETSCQPAVEAEFDHAVTLLHSFEYPETTRLFGEILETDPGCAMARWGLAMSLWHPLWAPPSPAELEAGAAILAGTEGMAMTAREQGYIDALRAFYADTDPLNHRARAQAYEERMSELYESHRDDVEAAVFYALSLLATQDPHDKSYAHQFKAAGILNWVRESEPYHPGVLHYIIHSYDYPGLAPLALGAATVYAEAAPDSAHAQHMPSHIFTRLGLWERSIASNHDSTASAAAYTERAHLPGHYDEGLHSIDYLMYAMLQTGRDDEAYRLLQTLNGITKADVDTFKVAYTYAASPARYALERRQWEDASRLVLGPESFPWDEFAWAQSIHHFARGIGAARSGQLDRAREERDTIRALGRSLGEATLPYWAEEVSVQADIVAAWIAFAEGDGETALSMARAAADREDAVDKHPVTPG